MDKIAELALSASKKQTNSTEVSETKRIGFMSDDCVVRRGTYDEAVVDVELESVANLIKDRRLKDALTKALRIYVATRGFSRIGCQPSRVFDCLVDFSDGEEIDGDAAHGYSKIVVDMRRMERPPNSKHHKGIFLIIAKPADIPHGLKACFHFYQLQNGSG